MHFEIIGTISNIEPIGLVAAFEFSHCFKSALEKGRWRKLKGVANVRLNDGTIRFAEIHWFEAHGIGKKEDEN